MSLSTAMRMPAICMHTQCLHLSSSFVLRISHRSDACHSIRGHKLIQSSILYFVWCTRLCMYLWICPCEDLLCEFFGWGPIGEIGGGHHATIRGGIDRHTETETTWNMTSNAWTSQHRSMQYSTARSHGQQNRHEHAHTHAHACHPTCPILTVIWL